MRRPVLRLRHLALVVGLIALLVGQASGAFGIFDSSGLVIPGTSTGSPTDQLVDPPNLVRKLAAPFAPGENDPSVVAELGWPGTPENDLAAALDALAGAPDATSATHARSLALDILEGNPVPGKAYSGIPLLNWNTPAKVKHVPAGGDVVVTMVRYGDHTLSDTWLLDFADPSRPFTITYRVSELDPAGVLAPTPLLVDHGRPAGGLHSVVVPLVLPEMPTGTKVTSRFAPNGGEERTRVGTQDLKVSMPPPGYDAAIVMPDLRPGHTSLATLEPASPERLARLQRLFGFSGTTPTQAEKLAAIAKLGNTAPGKLVWSDLRALDPQASGFLGAARAIGAQDRQLVAGIRTRVQVPNGVSLPGPADLTVVFQNNEAYVSARSLRLAPGAPLSIAVVNADGFEHRANVLQLANHRAVYGAIDWGQFDWSSLRADDEGLEVGPGESRRVVVTPASDAFELLVGDPDSGDQAGAAIGLDRGPDRQGIRLHPDFAGPGHDAQDAQGNVWVTLQGADKVVKLAPAGDLGSSSVEEYLLPGGNFNPIAPVPALEPHDIAIDGHGIVWVTLASGNAIARLDPAHVRSGTSDGITVFPLDPCPNCAPPFPPPDVPHPPSRAPEQMALLQDGDGNTVVWFSELAANAIGVLQAAPDGTKLASANFPCDCREPKGLTLGSDGAVWYTELANNRLGRLVPGQSRPFDVAAANVDHFEIPSGVTVQDPARPTVRTSSPHSVVFDTAGRLWFSEEATAKIGFLDLSKARPGTSAGFTEFDLPRTDFNSQAAPADLAVDRAGTVYFTDEYGDEVGTITAAGPGRRWRPIERQSLTDKPMLDTTGNLWFTETGANLVTRIAGVSAGAPAPGAPATFVADTAAGTLTGMDLREADSVDVVVSRADKQIEQATGVRVANGSFVVGAGGTPWRGAADPPIAAGDLITITPSATVAAHTTVVVPPPPPPPVRRISGSTREQTAIAASQASYASRGGGSSTGDALAQAVVLSRSDGFADALAGVPLAAAKGGPLLLTPRDHLDGDVRSEIERVLAPGGTVFLLGGPAALDRSIDRLLSGEGYSVTRLAGADRFSTAARIADAGLGSPDTVLLATGRDFADALTAGPAAAKARGAVLLSDDGSLPRVTAAYLTAHPGATVYALGGPAAIAAPSATPLVGDDRYGTAVSVARAFFPSAAVVGVASGDRFADALSGGADLARRGAPLLLTRADELPSAAGDYAASHQSTITDAVVYGGQAALDDSVVAALHDALTPSGPARTVVQTTSTVVRRPPLSFAVSDLTAAVGADGTLAGRAVSGVHPLAGHVTITVGPTQAGPADIDPASGGFTLAPRNALDPATAAGSLSWSGATIAGIFRTVSPFGPSADARSKRATSGSTTTSTTAPPDTTTTAPPDTTTTVPPTTTTTAGMA